MPPPATPVVLTQPYRAKDQKGGTLIAEEVTDSATHRRKMADVDAYRPPHCPTCLHPTLHMHDRRERKRRDDPEGVVEVFPRYRCAHPACRAVWMVLAGFMARHLHRAWSVVESALSRDGVVVESGSGSPMPPVAARTRQRWRARLLSSAAVVLQALAESASVGTEALLVLGQCSTRAGLVDALARSGAVSWSRRLAELAGWLHRLVPGLRVT